MIPKGKKMEPLDKLTSNEGNIIQVGDKITNLFEVVKGILQGNESNSIYDCENQLKEILDQIDVVKKQMHESVNEIYSEDSNNDYAIRALKDKESERKKLKLSYHCLNQSYPPIQNIIGNKV